MMSFHENELLENYSAATFFAAFGTS